MRPSALLREVFLNVLSGTSRTLFMMVSLISLSTSLQIADLNTTKQHVLDASDFQSSGASIQTITAVGRVSGDACVALQDLSSVRASGALRTAASAMTVSVLPQSPIPLYEVSAGFESILNADSPAGPGLVLSSEVMEALGVSAGETMIVNGSTATVKGTYKYPDDGRRNGLGFAALAETDTAAPFDECWVDVWPQDPVVDALLLTTVIPGAFSPSDQSPSLAPLNATRGESFSGGLRNAARITLWGYPLAALAAFGLSVGATYSRRLQFASALHAGVTRRALYWITVLESIAWVIPVGVAGFFIVSVFATSTPSQDVATTWIQGIKPSLLVISGGIAGSCVAVLACRERLLFKYFRVR